jgi:hypothetical protein
MVFSSSNGDVLMLRRSWPGALLLLVAAFPAPADEAAVKLEWKLKKGDTFFLKTDSIVKQTMRTPSLNKELKLETEQTTVFSVTVRDVASDKSVVLEYKIEGATAKSSTAGSAAAADEKLNQQLVGATFTVTLGPKGEVTKFEGYDGLVKKFAGDDKNAEKLVRAVLSEAELKARATDALGFLPDGPVKDGAKWERTSTLPFGPLGSFDLVRKYTYNGPAKAPSGKAQEQILYQVEAKYSAPAKAEKAPALPFQVVKGDLKAENFKGVIFFDAAAGRLDYTDMTVILKGTVTFGGPGQGGNIDTEVTVDQVVRTAVSDKNPLAPK